MKAGAEAHRGALLHKLMARGPKCFIALNARPEGHSSCNYNVIMHVYVTDSLQI